MRLKQSKLCSLIDIKTQKSVEVKTTAKQYSKK